MCLKLDSGFNERLEFTRHHFIVHISLTNEILIIRCDTNDMFNDKSMCMVYDKFDLKDPSIGDFENWIFSYDLINNNDKHPKNVMTDFVLCGRGTWWRHDSGIILLGRLSSGCTWCFIYYKLQLRYELRAANVVNYEPKILPQSAPQQKQQSFMSTRNEQFHLFEHGRQNDPMYDLFYIMNPERNQRQVPIKTFARCPSILENVGMDMDGGSVRYNNDSLPYNYLLTNNTNISNNINKRYEKVETSYKSLNECMPSIDWLRKIENILILKVRSFYRNYTFTYIYISFLYYHCYFQP